MYNIKKTGSCSHYKSVDQAMVTPYQRSHNGDCKNCIYFSSRNCGMEVADTIEPSIDFLS